MIHLITHDHFDKLAVDAVHSARRRSHYNVHRSLADPVQKLFVAATRDSYFRPHRHPDKSEFAIVIDGRIDLILFDDEANIIMRQRMGSGTEVLAFELIPNVWHSWLVVTDRALFFEVKQGPYIAETAAEFAPWAPAEGGSEVQSYLTRLRAGE